MLRIAHGSVILVVGLAILCSCADQKSLAPAPPDAARLTLRQVNPLVSQVNFKHPGAPTLDDKFGRVAGAIPGFGGAYEEHDGSVVIYLTDTTEAHAAHEALLAEFPGTRALGGPFTVKKGLYDYLQLMAWYQHLGERLSATMTPGAVEWTDIRESRNRLEVAVTIPSAESTLRILAKNLGIPDSALAIRYDPHPSPFTSSDSTLTSVWRPVRAGAYVLVDWADSAGQSPSGAACTLGFNAYRGSAYEWSLASDTDYAFTASHCTTRSGTFALDTMYQPLPSWGIVAVETSNPPYLTPSENPDCPTGYVCRYSDAVAFRYVDSTANGPIQDFLRAVPYAHGSRVAGNPDSVVTPDWFEQREQDTSYFSGGAVHKVGARTGDTWGFVNHTCLNRYGVGRAPSNAVLLCQSTVDSTADDDTGDSGGPVFVWTADYGGSYDIYLVGISSFGAPGTGFGFSTMAGILADFGWSDLHTFVTRC